MKWDKKRVLEKLKEIEGKLKRRPVKRDDPNLYFLARKHFGSWNNMMKDAGHVVKYKQKPKIPKLDSKELFYFMGLLCTDGHIQVDKKGGRYKLMIYTSYEEERDLIVTLIKNLFNYEASIRPRMYGFAKRINYEIYISSKAVCEFFNKIGIPSGRKSDTIGIPKIMKNNKNKWHFIRGVFDGDGSIIICKNSSTFKVSSGSKKFIEDLNNILIKEGINSAKIRLERETVWELRVHRREVIRSIFNLIYKNPSFFYPRKREKWSKQYI